MRIGVNDSTVMIWVACLFAALAGFALTWGAWLILALCLYLSWYFFAWSNTEPDEADEEPNEHQR